MDKRLFLEILEKQASNTNFWTLYIAMDYARKGISINSIPFVQHTASFLKYLDWVEADLKNSLEN